MKSLLHWKAGRLATLTAVTLLGSTAAWAQTVDGTRDASYPTALAVQTNSTGFGNSTSGGQEQANGSELDNIHAQIVGSDLYIFIGGNLESNFNKLELFFDTKSGGQNVLRGDNPNVDFNGLNSMAGLQFDAGFASDYYVTIGSGNNPLEVYTNIAETLTNGGGSGAFAGGGVGRTQNVDFDPGAGTLSGTVSIDNSNTAGVSDMAVGTPGTVATGIEIRIPLAALGTTANGGDIKLVAFVNNGGHTFLSNQVLAGLPASTGNVGAPGGVNFASFAGNQFVTVANGTVATQPDISVAPSSLNFYNVGVAGGTATRTVVVSNNGTAALNVTNITSNNSAFTPSITSFTVAPLGTTNVTVTFDPGVAGSITGTLTITSNDPGTPITTVSMSGTGISPGQVVLDGVVDSGLYGTAKVLQTNPTQFGDNQSELDGAYARVTATDLYLTLTGNLENGGNKLVVFFDANPSTGQQTFSSSNPTVDFGNSNNLNGLTFDRGFRPESFLSLNHSSGSLYANFAPMNGAGGNGTYLSGSTNTFTQPLDFGGGVLGELSFNNSNTAGVSDVAVGNPGAVQTGVELRIPLSVLGYTAGAPLHVMAVVTNPNYDYLSNQTLGGLPLGTGNLGIDGAGNGGSAPSSVNLANFAGKQYFTAQSADLTVSTDQTVNGGLYNNVTVAPGGILRLGADLGVDGALTVQPGGSLLTFVVTPAYACTNVFGTGSFNLQNGGSLAVCASGGIPASGNSGNIQLDGTRSYSTGGSYLYFSNAPQVTGAGLPATVRNLGQSNPLGLTLSQPVSIAQGLLLSSIGNLNTNGQALTLLSSAAGTALVVNSSTGVVNGTATVQRAITSSVTGPAYRHLSVPVSNTTFNDLAVPPAFTPNVSGGATYNSSTNPQSVTPFPTIFGYDQARLLTSPATSFSSSFDKGWVAPVSLGSAMQVMRGYTVNAPATATPIDFVGTLNNGNQTSGMLSRGTDPNAGWQFLGNPYPAPLDWSTVGSAQRPGLDPAMYVYQSTGQYTGSYRSYANGVGASPIINTGAGFWVRVSTPGGTGTLNLTNANRATSFAAEPAFGRGSVDTRPLLQLALSGAGLADEAYVYFERGASAAADNTHDAVKLSNPDGLNLASLAGSEALAINGLPELMATTIVPLQLAVPSAGTYVLEATALRNLPGTAYLLDASTGQRVNLRQQGRYSFTATAASLAGRFTLVFEPAAAPLASAAALEAARISVFPNPAHSKFTVLVPAVAHSAVVKVSMVNSLGQEVRSASQPAATADATAVAIDAAGLAAGVYTLRVQAGTSAPVTKRVVLE